ncbi:hypothetical protein [Sphingomicrobium clamense]|uniref:Uncharacterized protein n=1 Tax=Sphingomicrobium clamense TaxID=2851013 RepID=A0ABS6V8A8_9SPHN|nr:hypothetical protein [Sphingomicrobium sp. B8]MBW0145821.1 hypothetical protein [Sphingomicrobium sp. B8]
MSRKKRPVPPKPQHPRHWMDFVRWGIAVEVLVLASLTVYLSLQNPDPFTASDLMALLIMLLWVIAPGMIAYYAARPRKNLVPRLTWGLTGFIGNAWMIWALLDVAEGEGGSTAVLGLVVLPFYVLLAMLLAQVVPVILNMIRRHKL